MATANERKQLITRRALILGGVQFTAISALLARLYYLQFMKSSTYKTLAEDNRVNLQLIPPSRGTILDRKLIELAENQTYYRVLLERRERDETLRTIERIADILSLDKAALDELDAKLKQVWIGRSVMVKEHLSWDELSALEFHSPNLPGVVIETGQVRHYPLASEASHLIGYVGAVSEEELEDNQPVLKLPGFKIGKNGIEKTFEKRLRGEAGLRHIEVNVKGLPVRELERRDSVPGEALKLTVDYELQSYAAKRLAGESGAIVVMEVETGNVLALASMPAFDPNTFSVGITHGYWNELRNNPKTPLMNKAVTGQYPPGSTYKMVVGLAALEAGLITEQSRVFCPGHFFLGSHRFNCWKAGGHGSMNVVDALTQSCDTFFYQMAHQLGIEKVSEMARKLGLGAVSGIEIPAEKSGLTPTPDWKRASYGQPWVPGDTVNAGIGQGYVLTTPLQLAIMTARIAGGTAVAPTLLMRDDPAPAPALDVKQTNLAIIRQGMIDVVNSTRGTAYGKRLIDLPMTMAGKTGTSQVKRITQRGVDQNSIPWKDRHHGLFVGYGPFDVPRYAVAAIIEHGGGGSSAAAPVVRDVFLKLNEMEHGGPPAPLPEPPEEEVS